MNGVGLYDELVGPRGVAIELLGRRQGRPGVAGRHRHQGRQHRAAGLQILRATDLPVRLELGQAVIGQLVLAGKT